jgi:hypothetical protein
MVHRLAVGSTRTALIIALFCATSPALAGGRSNLPEAGAATRGLAPPRPTVESVSLQAQREIQACPDETGFQCVAAALTRYAAALQTALPPSH